MSTAHVFATAIAWVAVSTTAISADDLSKYRDFRLGTSLVDVARQTGTSAEPRVLQQRPALIQELMWQPPASRSSLAQGDSVKKVLFSFYNGHLFRMVVSYDRDRTEGLTAEDMVAAVSAAYGLPRLSATTLTPVARASSDSERLTHWQDSRYTRYLNYDDEVLARWGDAEHSVHLFRSSYQATFGLVIFSKVTDDMARAATVEAARLDKQEAPQREIDRQQKQTEDSRVAQAKAREANKVTFRP